MSTAAQGDKVSSCDETDARVVTDELRQGACELARNATKAADFEDFLRARHDARGRLI